MINYILKAHFLSYLILLCNFIHGSCANQIDPGRKLDFTHILKKNNLGFIVNTHSFSNCTGHEYRNDWQDKFKSPLEGNHTHLKPLSNTNSTQLNEAIKLNHKNTRSQELTGLASKLNKLFGSYLQSYKLAVSNIKSKSSQIKKLVLLKSSNLMTTVGKYIERAKQSKTYESLCNYSLKIKQRMSNLSVLEQFGVLLAGNAVYSFILPKYHIVFPFQLFPSESRLGTDIGLDTLVSIPFMYYFLKDLKISDTKFKITNTSPLKVSMVLSTLVGSFFLSSYFVSLVDGLVLLFSALNIPVSVEMLNAVSIISGHLFWVSIGSILLNKYVFPIFGGDNSWYKIDLKKTWVYDVLSGYFSSCLVYKFVDNLYLSLLNVFNTKKCESPTDQTISNVCESYKPIPIILTSIAPCITAPWWEELLYRVFTFKLLNSFLPSLPSSVLSSLLFSLNHLSMGSFFQLFSLGLLWSLIQNEVDNIFVTFLIHCLWNSRILLGSLTGF